MARARPNQISADGFQARPRELATFKTLSCYPAEWNALVAYSEANDFKTPMDLIRKMAHAWLPARVAASFRSPNVVRRENPSDSRDQSRGPRIRRRQPA